MQAAAAKSLTQDKRLHLGLLWQWGSHREGLQGLNAIARDLQATGQVKGAQIDELGDGQQAGVRDARVLCQGKGSEGGERLQVPDALILKMAITQLQTLQLGQPPAEFLELQCVSHQHWLSHRKARLTLGH